MHIRRLMLQGINAFADPIAVDLDQLPDGLISVSGRNGAGKTTFCESMAAVPLLLGFPSRPGKLQNRAVRRDAFIESVIDHDGSTFRHLVQIDPGTGVGDPPSPEAFLYELAPGATMPPAGTPPAPGTWTEVAGWPTPGRQADYRAALEGLGFPGRQVFLAGAFAADKGAGNFLEMDTAERRKLFVELLGLGELQALSDRAAAARKDLDTQLATVQEQATKLAADEQASAQLDLDIADATTKVQDKQQECAQLDKAATEAAQASATATAQLDTLQAARNAVKERLAELRERLNAVKDRATALTQQIAKDELLTEQAEEIRANTAEHTQLTERRAALLAEHAQHKAALESARRELQAAHREVDTLAKTRQELQVERARMHVAQARLDQAKPKADFLEAAQATHDDINAQLDDARRAVMSAEADATSVEAAQGHLDRLRRDVATLEGVPCEGGKLQGLGGNVVDCGECQFLTQARTARDQLPAAETALKEAKAQAVRVAETRETRDKLTLELAQAARHLADTQAAQAVVDQARAELARRDTVTDALETNQTRSAELTGVTIPATEKRRDEAVQTLERIGDEGRTARARLDVLQNAPDQLRALELAEAQLPERREALAQATEAAAQAQLGLNGLQVPPEPEQAQQEALQARQLADTSKAALTTAQAALAQLREALGGARGRRAVLGDLDARRRALDATTARLSGRRAGFREVERAFGRTGVQVLEIDAAAPSVARITNELLRATFGGRFAVRMDTIRSGTQGRQIETFDLMVLDGNRKDTAGPSAGKRKAPREQLLAPVADLSKGERILVDEALKLGIALFHAQRQGSRIATLWRDECDGGLDAENRRRYPAMLRAALELGGFRRLYFISHDAEVRAQADAEIVLSGGRVALDVR